MNQEKIYFEENSEGPFLSSDKNFIKWTQEFYKTKESYLLYSNLLKDNRNSLKDIIGRQNFCTYDSGMRRVYVWKVKLKYGYLWILTARERGTTYERSNQSPELRVEILNYLENLMNNIAKKKGGR